MQVNEGYKNRLNEKMKLSKGERMTQDVKIYE